MMMKTQAQHSHFSSNFSRHQNGRNVNHDIQEIEDAFILRRFRFALESANHILLHKLHQRNSQEFVNSDNDAILHNHKHHIVFEIPFHFPNRNLAPDGSQSFSDFCFCTSIPAPFTPSKSINNDCVVSIQERAATISLQCSYELWRVRRKQGQGPTTPSNEKDIDDEFCAHILPFLQLYGNQESNNVKGVGMDTSIRNAPNTTNIHASVGNIKLLFLWIKLVHAIGFESICVDMILSVIDVIFLSMEEHESFDTDDCVQELDHKFKNDSYKRDTHQHQHQHQHQSIMKYDDDENEDEILHNQCYDILHLLLLEILPLIQNKSYLDTITNELCIIMTRRIFRHCKQKNQEDNKRPLPNHVKHAKHSCNNNLILSPKPLLSSVKQIRHSVELILNYTRDEIKVEVHNEMNFDDGSYTTTEMNLIPKFVKECFEDCLEEIHGLEEQIEREHQKHLECEAKRDGIHGKSKKSLSSITNSLSNQLSPDVEFDDHDKNESPKNMKDCIVDYLWTSEDRWINRGKVATAGLLTYSILWRRRRQLTKATKSVGGVLIAPLQEIASALRNS